MDRALERRILIVMLVLALLNAGAHVAQWLTLTGMNSTITSFSQAFGAYPLFILASSLLMVGPCLWGMAVTRTAPAQLSLKKVALLAVLVLAGIVLIRFAFYCTYLTVGLS